MVIVTGATGFIGSAMIWQLNQRGFSDILAVDSVPPAQRPDVLKKRSTANFLLKDEIWAFLDSDRARSEVTAIVHMGACSSTTELNVAFLTENNFKYTQRLWDWCTRNQKVFIYASSGAVYGDGNNGFDDASPSSVFRPLNPYGESKAQFDRYVEDVLRMGGAAPPAWFGLRFFNVFGPNEYLKNDMASVVFKAFQQIEVQKQGHLKLFRSHHPDFKDGEQLRDFVYVKDIIRWMDELLIRSTNGSCHPVASGIYNMGHGKARTWKALAEATFASLSLPTKIEFIDIPLEMRPRYQYFTEAKMERLMGQGLSRPQWSLEDGIADYVKNYLLEFNHGSNPWL